MSDDFEITPAQRAYLAAFDRWLHTTWKVCKEPMGDTETELKDAALHDMIIEGPYLPRCIDCGAAFKQNAVGQRRRRCHGCQPRRTAA